MSKFRRYLLVVSALATILFISYFYKLFDMTQNEGHQVKEHRVESESPTTDNHLTTVLDCITGTARYTAVSDAQKLVPSQKLVPFEVGHVADLSPETHDKRELEFRGIFSDGAWAESDKFPKSGSGSTLEFTVEVRKVLDVVIGRIKREQGVTRIKILDVPCGDMTWMQHFLSTRNDVDYTGFDIVPELIRNHRERFSNETNWKFEVRDVVTDGMGSEVYDLVFSRMMLQHLYSEDVMVFLETVSKSGSKFLLTTTFPTTSVNTNFDSNHEKGRFRLLNLQAPPFSLSSLICYSRDGPNVDNRHYIGLWRLPLLQVRNCSEAKELPWLLDVEEWKYYGCQHFI